MLSIVVVLLYIFRKTMEKRTTQNRTYDTISPSAKALLMMKGLTQIPYARKAAELMLFPEPYNPNTSGQPSTFWARIMHFENRYQSISKLLQYAQEKNIIELSSGFSFRGIDIVEGNGIHYIDTDLPEVIRIKKSFLQELVGRNKKGSGSKLEFIPLNVMNETSFRNSVARFNKGPLVIVNEGLLIYLDMAEKKRLCRTIRGILQERGGYWITADIYIRSRIESIKLNEHGFPNLFFGANHTHKNMFDSYKAAEAFFNEEGFVIENEYTPDYTQLSGYPYLLKNTAKHQLQIMQNVNNMNKTWQLHIGQKNKRIQYYCRLSKK